LIQLNESNPFDNNNSNKKTHSNQLFYKNYYFQKGFQTVFVLVHLTMEPVTHQPNAQIWAEQAPERVLLAMEFVAFVRIYTVSIHLPSQEYIHLFSLKISVFSYIDLWRNFIAKLYLLHFNGK
jgi:hypothetical protein